MDSIIELKIHLHGEKRLFDTHGTNLWKETRPFWVLKN